MWTGSDRCSAGQRWTCLPRFALSGLPGQRRMPLWDRMPWLMNGLPVRVFIVAPDLCNPPDCLSAGPPSSTAGLILGRLDLVSTAAEVFLQLAMAPPRTERPPVTADRSGWTPQPQVSQILVLGAAGPDSLLMECTNSIGFNITNAQAPSTCLQQGCKWRRLSAWCASRGEDPVFHTVAIILVLHTRSISESLLPVGPL